MLAVNVFLHPVFLWIVGGLAASGLFMWALTYVVASYFIYTKTLRRSSKEQWSRDIPSDLTEESSKMYQAGLAWGEENKAYKKDVHIVRDGLNLYGEYYDFGCKRCVIVLSGRTECLKYGYYFAIPYAKNGCNVLVLDPRAHGLSDGEFNTVGFEESKDILAWVRFMHEEHGVNNIVFHGICIGAAGGMYALTDENCPDYIEGIVTEGMFANFGESMKNHLREKKKPVFILFDLVDAWKKHYTGHSMRFGPINVIDKLKKPLCMLHSQEDLYSRPEYAQKLYDLAGSENKRLVWFEKGKHSMLRITDTEKYDGAIAEFLKQLDAK